MRCILFTGLMVFAVIACTSEPEKETTLIFQKPEPKEHLVCRELGGQLLKDGKPLSNTKITRTLSWNGNEDGQQDYFTTDDNGYFAIPAHTEVLALSFMTQYVGKSKIEAYVDGEQILFWFEGLTHAQPNSLNGTNKMTCEVTIDLEDVDSGVGLLSTSCKWENMPEERDPYAI